MGENMIQKNCKHCGQEFTDLQRNNPRKYCSIACGITFRDRLRGRGIPDQRVCTRCGTPFQTTVKRKQYYCSKRCGTLASFNKVGRNSAGRDFVYMDKVAKGCSRCPERRPSCLQYHHLDPVQKVAGVGALVQGASLARVVEEVKKCILLCANCHFVETHGDGYRVEEKHPEQRETS
jgi:endogenous inhibitor of DNA gyrase (YacG/DUF329 family)